MTQANTRPSFKDCLKLSGSLLANTFGLVHQVVKVASVETIAAVGRRLSRATHRVEQTREAVGDRFEYTIPKAYRQAEVVPFRAEARETGSETCAQG